jgi:hypothetical protein
VSTVTDTPDDSEGGRARAAAEQYRDRDRRRRRRFWSVAGLACAVAAAATVWFTVRDHPAEAVVEEFFAALRADDVEAAVDLVDPAGVLDAGRQDFWTPEVLDFPWDAPEIDMVDADDRRAVVAVEVDTVEGAERAEYEVANRDGEWRLVSPFTTAVFQWPAADYAQANGTIVPMPRPGGPDSRYALLPGEYRFYESVTGLVEIDAGEPAALLNPEEVVVEVAEAAFASEALAAVQAEVDSRVDDCLEAYYYESCPFWHGDYVYTADGLLFDDVRSHEWTVEEPLLVSVGAYDPGFEWFPIVSEAGDLPLTLDATGEREATGEEDVPYTTRCEFDPSVWGLGLTAQSGSVEYGFRSGARSSLYRFSTCETELG